jgi:hypothetical protein
MRMLFHYTNLNSLECILKYRTIRFSSLAYVNDKYEGETQDIGNLGKYIFASCWTLSQGENERLWTMYGDNHHGVRIGLEFPIFELFFDADNNPSLVPHTPNESEGYTLMPTEINKLVIDISYTDELQDIKPKTLFEFWDQGIFDFGKVGKWKSTIWSDEAESRFLIYTLPIKWNNNPKTNGLHLIGKAIQLIKNNKAIPMTFIDIKIQQPIFRNMQITKGSNMTVNEDKRLTELIKMFNPDAEVIISSSYTL